MSAVLHRQGCPDVETPCAGSPPAASLSCQRGQVGPGGAQPAAVGLAGAVPGERAAPGRAHQRQALRPAGRGVPCGRHDSPSSGHVALQPGPNTARFGCPSAA